MSLMNFPALMTFYNNCVSVPSYNFLIFIVFYLITCTFCLQQLNNYTQPHQHWILLPCSYHTDNTEKNNDNDAGAESFAELFYHGCAVSLIKYQIYTTESLVLLMGFLLSILSKLLNSLSSNECLSIRWNAFWIKLNFSFNLSISISYLCKDRYIL